LEVTILERILDAQAGVTYHQHNITTSTKASMTTSAMQLTTMQQMVSVAIPASHI
jgi:hypothetical protein